MARARRTITPLPYTTLFRSGHLEHGADYTDSLSPWELANYGMVSEAEIDADYPVQSQCYAFSTATKHLGVKDSSSEEHTSELQSRFELVCRLLLEKKNVEEQ